jgi:cytochrome c-type biogenesis protein CcmH
MASASRQLQFPEQFTNMTPRTKSTKASYHGTTSVLPYSFANAGVLTPATHAAIIYASIFLLACAFVFVPIARAQQSDRAKKVGMKLMCVCGCAQVLVQCNHLNCPSSAPMLKELDERIASGTSDDMIVQDFVQGYGVQVLSSPPNSGFNRVAWLLPGIVFALGLGLVAWIVGRWRHNSLVTASSPHSPQISVSPDALARAREKVDRETEE